MKRPVSGLRKPFGNRLETLRKLWFPQGFQTVSRRFQQLRKLGLSYFPQGFHHWFPYSFRKFLMVSISGFVMVSVGVTWFQQLVSRWFPYNFECLKQAASKWFHQKVLLESYLNQFPDSFVFLITQCSCKVPC